MKDAELLLPEEDEIEHAAGADDDGMNTANGWRCGAIIFSA